MAFKAIIFVLSLHGKGINEEIIKDALTSLHIQFDYATGKLRPEAEQKLLAIYNQMNRVNYDLHLGDAKESIQKLITLLESW